jgi:hypothetical protein
MTIGFRYRRRDHGTGVLLTRPDWKCADLIEDREMSATSGGRMTLVLLVVPRAVWPASGLIDRVGATAQYEGVEQHQQGEEDGPGDAMAGTPWLVTAPRAEIGD